jgi:catechol 2,3-dioxygenase-like lactoylglutathione lyase family enzyme
MRITGVDHVQITIPQGAEDDARAFYCGLMGLVEIEKPESLKPNGGLWLMAGAMPVHIGAEDGVDRARSKAHVAYAVDDLAEWRAHLEAAGVAVVENTPIAGYARCMLRDPFGNRVELIAAL